MIWFLGIALICGLYFALYARHLPSHPVGIFMLYVFVYIAFKYFIVEGLGISYAYSLDLEGGRIERPEIHYGGKLLFIYFAGTAITHYLCHHYKIRVPYIRVVPRMTMVPWSIALMGLILAAAVAANGMGMFASHAQTRMALESKGMGYLMVAYTTVTTVAFVQVAETGSRWKLGLFFAVSCILFLISERSAILIGWIQLLLVYAVMVHRYVPYRLIAVMTPVLPALVLVQGIIRVRGGLTVESIAYLQDIMADRDAVRLIAMQLAGRIDPLERFSHLATLIRDRVIETDPLWPLYVFVQFVPRGLWPDKPFFFNNQMMSMFYPVSFKAGVSFNFLGPGEMLYSFGVLGLLPAFLLTGYLLYATDRAFGRARGDAGVFLIYYIVIWPFLLVGFNVGWMNNVALSFAILNFALLFLLCRVYVVREKA